MPSLSASLWSAYKKGKFTDLTIRCGASGKEFKVHKVILCSQSKVFEAMTRPPFIESETNTITLKDDNPEVFESALEHLYCGYYICPSENHQNCRPNEQICLYHHALVYAFADKYDIMSLAENALENHAEYSPRPRTKTTPGLIYIAGNETNDYGKFSVEYWESFFESLSLIFSTTPIPNRHLLDSVAKRSLRSCFSWLKCKATENIKMAFLKFLKEEQQTRKILLEYAMIREILMCPLCEIDDDEDFRGICQC